MPAADVPTMEIEDLDIGDYTDDSQKLQQLYTIATAITCGFILICICETCNSNKDKVGSKIQVLTTGDTKSRQVEKFGDSSLTKKGQDIEDVVTEDAQMLQEQEVNMNTHGNSKMDVNHKDDPY